MSFVVWASQYNEGSVVVRSIENVDREFELNNGVSRAKGFPDDALVRMDPEFPKDLELTDNLHGTIQAIVSKKLKAAISSMKPANVEFLNVRVLNHKGKVASDEYFVMNPLEVVDCIDTDKSGVVWNRIKKDMIASCKKLVLKKGSVSDGVLLFRPKHMTRRILVSKALADRLSDGGFSGLRFAELDETTR